MSQDSDPFEDEEEQPKKTSAFTKSTSASEKDLDLLSKSNPASPVAASSSPVSTVAQESSPPKVDAPPAAVIQKKRRGPKPGTIPTAKRRKTGGKNEQTEQECYLKLDCMELISAPGVDSKRFSKYVEKLPVKLGRTGAGDEKTKGFIALGSSPLIGAHHATISFNFETGYYELCVTGKNGVVVGGQKFDGVEGLEVGKPIQLKPKQPVRIGNVGFYVCFPDVDKPKKSYADLSIEALEAKKPHGILQMTSRDIAQYIIEAYPYYNVNYGNTEKMIVLSKACQTAISKCEKIVSVPSGVRGRVSYQLGVKETKPKESKEAKDAAAAAKESKPSDDKDVKPTPMSPAQSEPSDEPMDVSPKTGDNNPVTTSSQ